jgi:iron-sulfur cluster assembly accessory protein
MDHKIEVTDSAFRRIKFLQDKAQNSKLKLRIKVTGGGCSGFSYDYAMTEESSKDDIIFKKSDSEVVIDPKSIKFLKESKIDFVEALGSQYFSITNPNATAKCGCGNSFSI